MARFAITGSSGLVGSALAARLEAAGHEVVRMRRGDPADPQAFWNPEAGWVRETALDGCDGLVHLAGASVGEGRWTAARKKELRTSRIEATRLLTGHMGRLQSPPRVLVSASASGYYGDRGDELLAEDALPGTGFLASLVREWEVEAFRAQGLGVRTAVLRLGVVLAGQGGALQRMLLPFRLGVGGRLGNGRQWMSWISLDDAVSVFQHALGHEVEGPINAAAPVPVTNREFTAALAKTLRRPGVMPLPRMALRLMFGEMADEMLLASQRLDAAKLLASGFEFRHSTVAAGLAAALGRA